MSEKPAARVQLRDRLVEVAAELLSERGRAAVTTRGVAERAGVQAPTIYRLFGDKDGLLDAVAEHAMATFASQKAAAVSTAGEVDPVADLRAGWDMTIDFGLANPDLFVLISDPARGPRSPAARAGIQLLADRVHRVALTGRLRVEEDLAVELIHAAGTGAILSTLSRPENERDRRLADVMFEAVLSRLVTDPDEVATDTTASAAIALRAEADQLVELTTAERSLLTEWLGRLVDRRAT